MSLPTIPCISRRFFFYNHSVALHCSETNSQIIQYHTFSLFCSLPPLNHTHTHTTLKTTQLCHCFVQISPKSFPFRDPLCPSRAYVIFPQAIYDLISYYSSPGHSCCSSDTMVTASKSLCFWIPVSSYLVLLSHLLQVSAQNTISESGKPDMTPLT